MEKLDSEQKRILSVSFTIALIVVALMFVIFSTISHASKYAGSYPAIGEIEKAATSMYERVQVQDCSDIIIDDIEVVEEEPIEEIEEAVEEPLEEEVVEDVYYEEVYYEEPSYTEYYYNESGLTPQSGVNYYNDRKETYYSSNVLYHYRTEEWTVGSDGVYRDSDGYVVVAASDIPFGETVDTSFGMGKVYDTGCAAGVTDIYTNW